MKMMTMNKGYFLTEIGLRRGSKGSFSPLASLGKSLRLFPARSVVWVARISSKEELKEIKRLSEVCANNNRQLRGIGTNINQMTRIAHQTGALPTIAELENISREIKFLRKEEVKNWQSIRQLISLQVPTGQ